MFPSWCSGAVHDIAVMTLGTYGRGCEAHQASPIRTRPGASDAVSLPESIDFHTSERASASAPLHEPR